MMSGTFLGFDFGTKSIGVAVGQRITATARPLPALKAQDGKPDWNIIEKLLKEWQPEAVIVGLPLNMDDERLSTVEARAGLFEHGGYRALNKGSVDSASAVVILESYFEQSF